MTKRNANANTPAPVPMTDADRAQSFALQLTVAEQGDRSRARFADRLSTLRAHRLAASSADLAKILGQGKKASVFEFTQSVSSACDDMGIDTAQIFATDRNPKVIKRFIQFVHGINARDYKSIDKTTAKILYAMRLAGEHALTTDALAYIVSGKVRPTSDAPETRGVSTRTVSRLFGHVGATTAPTQISRSVGDNGFLQLCGATSADRGKVNRPYTLNAAHPMVTRFFAVVEGATDGQLSEITGQGEAGE
jgi:hypothetical protein